MFDLHFSIYRVNVTEEAAIDSVVLESVELAAGS